MHKDEWISDGRVAPTAALSMWLTPDEAITPARGFSARDRAEPIQADERALLGQIVSGPALTTSTEVLHPAHARLLRRGPHG